MSTSSALTLGRGRSTTVKVGCRQTLLALKATRCGCTATLVPVMRWTLDELPLARRLFGEVVEGLYRDDHHFRGALLVGGRLVVLEHLHPRSAAPINAAWPAAA